MPWKKLSKTEVEQHSLYGNISLVKTFTVWTMGLAFIGLLLSFGELMQIYQQKNIYNLVKEPLIAEEYIIVLPSIINVAFTFLLSHYALTKKSKEFLKVYLALAILMPILNVVALTVYGGNSQSDTSFYAAVAFAQSSMRWLGWTIFWGVIFYFSKSFNLNYFGRVRAKKP